MVRPLKFSQEITDKIIERIKNNVPYEVAVHVGKISIRTWYYWIRLAEDAIRENEENEYTEFYWRLRQAEVDKLEEHLKAIESRVDKWQANAWLLQRRYPHIYGDHAFQLKELEERLTKLEFLRQQPKTFIQEVKQEVKHEGKHEAKKGV